MATKCKFCNSTSYGIGCHYSPHARSVHEHVPGEGKCVFCGRSGSSGTGIGCPYSPSTYHQK